VVTVRVMDADADRLPLVGHTRSETSCTVVAWRPLRQHVARWPFHTLQNPAARRCRSGYPRLIATTVVFLLVSRFSLFLPFSTSIPLHVTRRVGPSAARAARRHV